MIVVRADVPEPTAFRVLNDSIRDYKIHEVRCFSCVHQGSLLSANDQPGGIGEKQKGMFNFMVEPNFEKLQEGCFDRNGYRFGVRVKIPGSLEIARLEPVR